MSQVNEHNDDQVQGDPFDAGFDIDAENHAGNDTQLGQEQSDNHDGEQGQDAAHTQKEAEQPPYQRTISEAATSPQHVLLHDDTAPPPQHEQEEEQPLKTVEVPEHIKDEWVSLRKINPAAAALAMEDSQEGETMRARLEQYGADIASDKAEHVLFVREQTKAARQVQVEQERRAVEAHNAHFTSVIQRDHQDVFAMTNDPARKTEAAQFMNNIMGWIGSKPYAEAEPLMHIAKHGRDPVQVSALISQYKRECGGAAKRPDHTAALAVPGRGAPVAPSGIGDKDDFDAGWDVNESK